MTVWYDTNFSPLTNARMRLYGDTAERLEVWGGAGNYWNKELGYMLGDHNDGGSDVPDADNPYTIDTYAVDYGAPVARYLYLVRRAVGNENDPTDLAVSELEIKVTEKRELHLLVPSTIYYSHLRTIY